MKKILLYLLSIIIIYSNVYAETNNEVINNTSFSDDLYVQLISAFATFILTSIVSYIVYRKNSQKQPNYEFSYSKLIQSGLVKVDDSIKDKTQILFNGVDAENLNYVNIVIENTGNRTITNQQFIINMSCEKILEEKPNHSFREEHEFEELVSSEEFEKIFKIKIFEIGKKFQLTYVLQGEDINVEVEKGLNEDILEVDIIDKIIQIEKCKNQKIRESIFSISITIISTMLLIYIFNFLTKIVPSEEVFVGFKITSIIVLIFGSLTTLTYINRILKSLSEKSDKELTFQIHNSKNTNVFTGNNVHYNDDE